MDNADTVIPGQRQFRVVRFYPHYGHGLMEDVIGDDLTLEEAEELVRRNPPVATDEAVVIQDKTKSGLDAELRVTDDEDPGPE
jgi:hypothetical protein